MRGELVHTKAISSMAIAEYAKGLRVDSNIDGFNDKN